MAPMTSVPSWPRLMRPLFSVSVSPRLTKMNGVLLRIAPAMIASGTPHSPRAGDVLDTGMGRLRGQGFTCLFDHSAEPNERLDHRRPQITEPAGPGVEPEQNKEQRALEDL